jgi:hypothetical protein
VAFAEGLVVREPVVRAHVFRDVEGPENGGRS